jgi:sucrose-6-phosphate hydrolase SacC (GH32 family)
MIGTRPARYWIGTFDPGIPAFVPDEPEGKLLDCLNPFHCFNPSTVDNEGPGGSPRRIIESMQLYASGQADGIRWSGVHALPRVLSRDGDRLTPEPVPEIESLRGRHQHFGQIRIPAGAAGLLPGVRGDALEIIAEFEAGTAKRFGMVLRASLDGKAGTRAFYDVATVRMRIFLDRSLLEVFVNGQTGTGVFNTDVAATGLDLFSECGEARLTSLDVWEMKPFWTLPK